jgi:ribonuclease VapC
MIVDSSALVAILKEESDAPRFQSALARATGAKLSAASYLEASIVTDKTNSPLLLGALDSLVSECLIEVVPFTRQQAHIAREAYRKFGRGSGHPARLNFGDCFAYALAAETGEALLFKGNDFSETDIVAA